MVVHKSFTIPFISLLQEIIPATASAANTTIPTDEDNTTIVTDGGNTTIIEEGNGEEGADGEFEEDKDEIDTTPPPADAGEDNHVFKETVVELRKCPDYQKNEY